MTKESHDDVDSTVTAEEAAGFVGVQLDFPGGHRMQLFLTPAHAEDLADRLLTAALEVHDA